MSELQLKGKQAKEASYFLGNVTSEQNSRHFIKWRLLYWINKRQF